MRLLLAVFITVAVAVMLTPDEPAAVFPDGFRTSLLIADDPVERAQGLMNRAIDEDQAMLFVFEEPGTYAFWMKDVPHSLDVILLNEKLVVVDILSDLQPCSMVQCPIYEPSREFVYAIEVRGGFAGRHGVELGRTVWVQNLNI